MKLYDCTVRLNGSLHNEVNKADVTPAEVHVLRALHGSDAVINVKPAMDGKKHKVSKVKSAEERARLTAIYANPTSLTAEDSKKKRAMLTELFGHESMPLPEELVEAKVEESAEVDFAA
jgi:hypothetical protein